MNKIKNDAKTHSGNQSFERFAFLLILIFAVSLRILPESKSKPKKYKRNYDRVQAFKSNMSKKEIEYYEPRKRFIDKQSVKPSDEIFYQIDIILRGTALREKNKKNLTEIRKLEKFLLKADDFQFNRYFGLNEELFLGMKAEKAIQSIKKEAKLDENWRRKNDPIFRHYLKYEATKAEKKFYKKNKALFFKTETGDKLIHFLKVKTEEQSKSNN